VRNSLALELTSLVHGDYLTMFVIIEPNDSSPVLTCPAHPSKNVKRQGELALAVLFHYNQTVSVHNVNPTDLETLMHPASSINRTSAPPW
jgi:hypothetical protein